MLHIQVIFEIKGKLFEAVARAEVRASPCQRVKVSTTLSPARTLTSWVCCCCDSCRLAVTVYVPGETSMRKSSSGNGGRRCRVKTRSGIGEVRKISL